MGPPKCKTCGVTEWRHLCGIPVTIAEIQKKMSAVFSAPKSSGLLAVPKWKADVIAEVAKLGSKPKTDRKEYLKLKARERRARQKAKL